MLNGTHSSARLPGLSRRPRDHRRHRRRPGLRRLRPPPLGARDHPDAEAAAGRETWPPMPRRCSRATPTRRSATAPGRSPWTAARSCRSASSAPSPTTCRAGAPEPRPDARASPAGCATSAASTRTARRSRSTTRSPPGSESSRTAAAARRRRSARCLSVREVFDADAGAAAGRRGDPGLPGAARQGRAGGGGGDRLTLFALISRRCRWPRPALASAATGGCEMKTIKGPALFLAQFAGDAAPFNSLGRRSPRWAAEIGYMGVQVPTWDARLFDLDKAAASKDYCDEIKGMAARERRRRSPSSRPICRASWSPCIRPTTRPSTASRRRRCAAIRRRGRNGRSSR